MTRSLSPPAARRCWQEWPVLMNRQNERGGLLQLCQRCLAACCFLATNALAQDAPPDKKLPLPGDVFRVEGHTAFVIPAEKPATGEPIPSVWYAPTLPNLPGPEERWMFERF